MVNLHAPGRRVQHQTMKVRRAHLASLNLCRLSGGGTFRVIPLSDIKLGQSAVIVRLANDGPMAGRLIDLGFAPGAAVTCVLQKPKKNIAAYLVRSAVIALRRQDSRLVMVRELPEESPAKAAEPPAEAPEESPAKTAGQPAKAPEADGQAAKTPEAEKKAGPEEAI